MDKKKQKLIKLPKIKLIRRQEMWTLTTYGWGIAIAFMIVLFSFAITHIQPFLAVNSPIKADILVVEGWLTDYGIKQAITEFEKGSYKQLITTGIPLQRGYYLAEYKDFANLAAATLVELGFDQEKITPVPTPGVEKDRTEASVIALKEKFANTEPKIKTLNLISDGVHARRSWMIYKKVLSPDIKVGIIAAETRNYNQKKWWSSSEGVRVVLSELIAYIYALFAN
jgi:DUF218 domain